MTASNTCGIAKRRKKPDWKSDFQDREDFVVPSFSPSGSPLHAHIDDLQRTKIVGAARRNNGTFETVQ